MTMTDRQKYSKVTTDHLLFTLEPGRASRTKFAIEIAKTISTIDAEMLEPDEADTLSAIKAEVQSFLL